MNKLLAVLFWLTATVVIGAGIQENFPTDRLKWGLGSLSTDDRILEVDTGDGATNPKITINMTDKVFEFNKALKVVENLITLGDGTNSETVIEFDVGLSTANPKFRWNSTDNRLEFANDGVLFKAIGSGSGNGSGGINELANSGFEDGVTSEWVTAGGNLAEIVASADVGLGEKSARFVATAPGDYYESALTTFQNIVIDGKGCMADFFYKGGQDFLVKVLYEDLPSNPGSFLEAVSEPITNSDDWYEYKRLTFNCQQNMKIRFEATAGSSIDLDEVYLGSNKGFTSVGFLNSVLLSGSDGRGIDADTEDMHFVGTGNGWTGGADNQPSFYTVQKNGSIISLSAGVLYSGGIGSVVLSIYKNGSFYKNIKRRGSSPTINQHYVRYTSSLGEFNAGDQISLRSSQTGSLAVDAVGANHYLVINEKSDEQRAAYTPGTDSFYVEALIFNELGGVATIPTVTKSPLYNGNFTLQNIYGSASIVCDSGISNGSDCATGNEGTGITVNLPRSGRYEVCSHMPLQYGNTQLTTKVVMTELSTDTILIDSQREEGRLHSPSTAGETILETIRTCNVFNIGSSGQKTFKTFMLSTGGTNRNFPNRNFLVDGETSMKFTVRMVNHYESRPIIQDMVSTRAISGSEKGACHITDTGTASFDSGDPDCWMIQSVSKPLGTGRVQITFIESGFKCVLTSLSGNVNSDIGGQSGATINTASLPQIIDVQSRSNTGGTLGDVSFAIFCSKNK